MESPETVPVSVTSVGEPTVPKRMAPFTTLPWMPTEPPRPEILMTPLSRDPDWRQWRVNVPEKA
jgi:hypothetical protein